MTLGELTVDTELEESERIVFCITCLKRDPQLLSALAINCVLWWPMRKYWRIALCTFGDDETLCCELKDQFKLMIELGLLVIASGGAHERSCTARGQAEKPAWMPEKPQEALHGGSTGMIGMPLLQYWHASQAKNAAHQLANHAFGSNCCWVSFDCDQIAPIDYLISCLKLHSKKT